MPLRLVRAGIAIAVAMIACQHTSQIASAQSDSLSLATLASRTVTPAELPHPHARTFAQVVAECFPAWDANRDGRLESREIDALMTRHQITGEAAAALAAIKARERRIPANERARFFTTLSELTDPAYEVTTGSVDIARDDHEPFRYQARYRSNLSTLETLVRRLYASTAPNFLLMRQGKIGDCYFFSVTGCLAARHPEHIVRMIEPIPGGGYLVRFHPGVEVRVPEPTEAEILVNNSASSLKDGIWLPVLEIAVGELMRSHAKQGKRTAEPTDAMASGGHTAKMLELYSGHHTEAIHFRARHHAGGEHSKAALGHLLAEALSRGRLVAACTASPPANGKKIPGLGYHHSYAILDYDPRTEVVTIWNPWGQTFKPKGEDGPEHGYTTEHGVFHMPLQTLEHHFVSVILESPNHR